MKSEIIIFQRLPVIARFANVETFRTVYELRNHPGLLGVFKIKY